jgi:hypothetical protein
MSTGHFGWGGRLDGAVRAGGSDMDEGDLDGIRPAADQRAARHRSARALISVCVAAGMVLVGAACAPTGTDELGNGTGGTAGAAAGAPSPDGYPSQEPDGYPSPQVMAEVTLPDGSVATVPQPEVPLVTQPPSAAAAPAVPAVPDAPPAIGSPDAAPTGRAPATSAVAPADDRAVQKLSSAAAVAASSKALGLLRIDWRGLLPGWQIRFLPGRAGIRGATFPDTSVIEIYVRASDTPNDLAHVIAHELGHAVDVSRFSDADRSAWKAARGIALDASWFPSGAGAADYLTPAGDWAESFASWLVGSGWFSKLGPPPNVAQKAVVAALSGVG